MSMFFAGMVPVAPPPPPNPPAPRVSGSIRPLMQPKGVADPGDFPDNEHGAAVRESCRPPAIIGPRSTKRPRCSNYRRSQERKSSDEDDS